MPIGVIPCWVYSPSIANPIFNRNFTHSKCPFLLAMNRGLPWPTGNFYISAFALYNISATFLDNYIRLPILNSCVECSLSFNIGHINIYILWCTQNWYSFWANNGHTNFWKQQRLMVCSFLSNPDKNLGLFCLLMPKVPHHFVQR